MLTERTYDRTEFLILLNIVTICVFIAQQLTEALYETLGSIMLFISFFAIKVRT